MRLSLAGKCERIGKCRRTGNRTLQKNTISVDHLPKNIVPDKDDMSIIKIPVGISLKEAEKEIIQKTLQMTRGSKKEAANILGISSRKIEYKVKEWQ